METRRSEWEEYKDFTEEHVRAISMKKYNNLLTPGRRYNKEHKDSQILDLVGVEQKLADDSKKSSEKSNRESTKVEPAYTRDLPPWIPEEPKRGVENKTKEGKEYCWYKEHCAGKGQWVLHKT